MTDASVALKWFLRDAPGEDHQAQALDDLHDLLQLPLHTAGTPDVLARAVVLAVQLHHHLSDTLYHAVALQTPGAVCVTADRRYLDKAHALGRIIWLGDYQHA